MKKYYFIWIYPFIWAFIIIMLGSVNISACLADNPLPNHGVEITISDRISNSTFSESLGISGEDNEVEHGSWGVQKFDLEAMYWDSQNSSLSIVGGFNYTQGYMGVSIGDVFVGDDIVFDFERKGNDNLKWGGTFDIIQDYTDWIDPTQVAESTPFQYNGGGAIIGSGVYSIEGFYMDIPGDPIVDVSGWYGNDIHWDLTLTGDNSIFDNILLDGDEIHLTMGCGNDTIKGAIGTSPVPIPGTGILFLFPLMAMFINRGKRDLFD